MKVAREVREIALESLSISKHQVRTREVAKDLQELVENIRIHGQLEPIVVFPTGKDGRFDIVAGQRRWLAMTELGYQTIAAVIIDEPIDDATIRTLSISENLVRRDLDSKDLIDSCTLLYRKYGSVIDVAKETGLPATKVRNYVKFDRLRQELKESVEAGKLDIKTALRVEDYCQEVDADEDRLKTIIGDVQGMTNAQQVDYFESGRRGATSKVSKIPTSSDPEERRRPGNVHQILVTLRKEDHTMLREWAKSKNLTQDKAAAWIINGFFRSSNG